jgi:hypothetical protein
MTARRSGHAPSPPGGAPVEAPTLPAWKAFVVQLSLDTVPGSTVFAGRVEHLGSGRRARFDSKQELLAIVERLLREIEDQST